MCGDRRRWIKACQTWRRSCSGGNHEQGGAKCLRGCRRRGVDRIQRKWRRGGLAKRGGNELLRGRVDQRQCVVGVRRQSGGGLGGDACARWIASIQRREI